jgi:glycosyltransferase involved in cell wall biosynthesis
LSVGDEKKVKLTRRTLNRRIKVGLIANEFFESALGGRGGFGWGVRQVAECFNGDSAIGVDVVFLTNALRPEPGQRETLVDGTRLLFQTRRPAFEYFRLAWLEGIDLLLTMDYRPQYRSVFRALPRTPILIWVRDPRTPQDVEKVLTLRIPGAEGVRPMGIKPFDCTSLREVVRASRWLRRRVTFATPAPYHADKVLGTYGVRVSEINFLPNIIDIDLPEVTKCERPRVIFLGRLDPIKRPWLFVELARRFPDVEFLFLGKSHFHGEGSWEPKSLPENVRLMGHIDGAEKYHLLSSAWVLVNTSIHESLAISYLEALACETPLLSCQDPGGLVSQFGIHVGRWDGTGLEGIPTFVEGLRRLLSDQELRTRLGQEGRRWVAETHSRSRFLAAFDELCERADILKSLPVV